MNKLASSDHATTDRLTERAHESVDRVARTAGKGEEKIRHGATDAEARVRDAGKSISDFVHDKPLVSLGIAFAAGTVLSVLLSRRS